MSVTRSAHSMPGTGLSTLHTLIHLLFPFPVGDTVITLIFTDEETKAQRLTPPKSPFTRGISPLNRADRRVSPCIALTMTSQS